MQISVYAKALNETMSESGFEFKPETVAKAFRGNPGVPVLTDAESLSNEIKFDTGTGERFQDWDVRMHSFDL